MVDNCSLDFILTFQLVENFVIIKHRLLKLKNAFQSLNELSKIGTVQLPFAEITALKVNF